MAKDQTSSTDLGAIITNNGARKIVWAVYAILGLAYGTVIAYLGATQQAPALWLVGLGGAIGFLAGPMGTLAIANISTGKAAEEDTFDPDLEDDILTEGEDISLHEGIGPVDTSEQG